MRKEEENGLVGQVEAGSEGVRKFRWRVYDCRRAAAPSGKSKQGSADGESGIGEERVRRASRDLVHGVYWTTGCVLCFVTPYLLLFNIARLG